MPAPTATLRTVQATANRYQVYTQDFDFTSAAANQNLEYDGTAYPELANLAPNELESEGLTMRVVVTAPGGAVEGDPGGWPCYRHEEFVYTAPHAGDNGTFNYYPTFDVHGRFRYQFQQAGSYTLNLYLTDKNAAAGVLCATWTVAVTDTGLPGRVRPALNDPKRLQTRRQAATGDALAPLGHKGATSYTSAQAFAAALSQAAASGAPAPLMQRVWAGSRAGSPGVFGGYHFDDGGSAPQNTIVGSVGNTATSYRPFGPLAFTPRGGRYWFKIGAGEQFDARVALKAATAYTLQFKVAVQASDLPAGAGAGVYCQCLVQGDFAGISNGATTTVASMANGTVYTVSMTIPAKSPFGADNYIEEILLKTTGITSGYVYIGDCQVLDPQGRDVYGEGDWSWHVRPNRRSSCDLDQLMALYEAVPLAGVRLLMFDKSDASICQVDSNGVGQGGWDSGYMYGKTTAADSNIPVRRWHRQHARYLVARYGANNALWMVEGLNEADITDGNHTAFAQNLGHELRRWLPDLPFTSSHSFNDGGVDYDQGGYEGGVLLPTTLGVTIGGAVPPKLPDITCGDEHFYDAYGGAGHPGGQGFPYNETGRFPGYGWYASPGAGPNGETAYSVDATSGAAWIGPSTAQAELQLTALRLKGAGQWQVRFWARGSGGVQQAGGDRLTVAAQPFNGGPNSIWDNSHDASGVAVPANSDFPWTEFQGLLVVPDDAYYTFGSSRGFKINPGRLTSGKIDVYDLRLIDPQGRIWYRFIHDENWVDLDLIEKQVGMARMYQGYQGLGVGQPTTAGEAGVNDLRHLTKPGTTWNSAQGQSDPNLICNAIWADDTSGHVAEELAWAAINPGAFLTLWWDPVPSYYKAHPAGYAASSALNAMLAGAKLGSGAHYAGEWRVTDRSLIPLGTWDHVNKRGAFLLRNRTGCAANQVYYPGSIVPVTATATLTGNGASPAIPDGDYVVEYWPTAAPNLVGGVPAPTSSVTLTAAGGALAIPVTGLTGRVGVKVYAAPAPAGSGGTGTGGTGTGGTGTGSTGTGSTGTGGGTVGAMGTPGSGTGGGVDILLGNDLGNTLGDDPLAGSFTPDGGTGGGPCPATFWTLDDYVRRVLHLLNLTADDVSAGLYPTAGGAAVLTAYAQICALVNECAGDLCRDAYPVPDWGSLDVAAGWSQAPLTDVSMSQCGTLWYVRAVRYAPTGSSAGVSLAPADPGFSDLYYPPGSPGGTPAFYLIFGTAEIGVAPAVATAGTLAVSGLVVPAPLVNPGDRTGWLEPDLSRLLAWGAAWRLAEARSDDDVLAPRVPVLKAAYEAGKAQLRLRARRADPALALALWGPA